MRTFKTVVLLALVFAFAAIPTATAQTLFDSPRVQTAVRVAATKLAARANKPLKPIATGGGTLAVFNLPVLKVNRRGFQAGDVLQSWLELPVQLNTPVPVLATPALSWVAWALIPAEDEFGQTQYGWTPGVFSLQLGERIPVQSYIWTGNEAAGRYILAVGVYNQDFETVAVTATVVTFLGGSVSGYNRIDSAVLEGGQIHLRGNFTPTTKSIDFYLQEFVEIDGLLLPILRAYENDAYADLQGVTLPPGFHDLTLVMWTPGNRGFDSMSAPGVLTIR